MSSYYNISTAKKVIVDESNIHLMAHEKDLIYLREAIARAVIDKFSDEVQKIQVDMGRIIGTSICVTTTEEDEIFFGVRKGRRPHQLTRFVKNREPKDCRFVTLILKRTRLGDFRLYTMYIGELAPMELSDRNLRKESHEVQEEAKKFWSTHALIWQE